MRTASTFEEMALAAPALLTIGTFDGVHRGHLFLLEQAQQRANEHGYGLVIVTFDPNPAVVLRPSLGRYQITSREQKLRLLSTVQPALVAMLPFTLDLAHLTADEFMVALEGRLDLREMWLGEDFHFGRDRQGGLSMLVDRGRQSGFSLHVVPRRVEDAASISSTRVRQALAAGDVAGAVPLLGRPFGLDLAAGRANPGNAGAAPTLAFDVPPHLILPADGVYAAICTSDAAAEAPAVAAVDSAAPEQQVRVWSPVVAVEHCTLEFISRLGSPAAAEPGLEILYPRVQTLLRDWRRPVYPPSGRY